MATPDTPITGTLHSYRGGFICERCGFEGQPLEPLFDLHLAAELVPMRYRTLQAHLSIHKAEFPARYRLEKSHRRVRLISASEIKRIRAQVLRGPGKFI